MFLDSFSLSSDSSQTSIVIQIHADHSWGLSIADIS